MNLVQLLNFALGGLWRQKVRTALTLVGVTVGTCALAFSLALGLGLRAFIDKEFKGRDDFWRIVVRVDEPPADESAVPEKDRGEIEAKGAMSPERAARIREALLERYHRENQPQPAKLLTKEALAAMARLPGVTEVRTYRSHLGHVSLGTAQRPKVLAVTGPLDGLDPRLIAGRLPEAPDASEIVLSEFALYQLELRDDADLERVLGRPVTIEVGEDNAQALAVALIGGKPRDDLSPLQVRALQKVARTLPERIDAFDLTAEEKLALQNVRGLRKLPGSRRAPVSGDPVSATYRVCGVARVLTREERKKTTPLDAWELTYGDAFLPSGAGEKLFTRLPWEREDGARTADVRIAPGGDLPGTVAAIEEMGFKTHSGAKWFAAAKREVTLIAAGLNLFALIALFVASVGITNTLVTSVIERTKEIGILRAVGATRGQILSLFLLEGSLIGFAGAGTGLWLARGLAAWADGWVRGLIAGQMDGQPMLSTSIFVFPWWLWAGSVGFAVGVTTLAALYPARRAAQIHPIEALRYG